MTALWSKPAIYIYIAIAAALALWGAYIHVYNNGYEAAELHYKAEIAANAAAIAEATANEQRRQTIANNAAKAREAAAIAELEKQESENEELRRRLADEAMHDPDAGRPAFGVGSVQRINKIR